mmetsp:Transcript_8527/g.21308  ORF Transcript_8527/g.21308 Transcript_8527/m.21308 type:complete len:279 (-) Transcript_8527:1363-2199(-)
MQVPFPGQISELKLSSCEAVLRANQGYTTVAPAQCSIEEAQGPRPQSPILEQSRALGGHQHHHPWKCPQIARSRGPAGRYAQAPSGSRGYVALHRILQAQQRLPPPPPARPPQPARTSGACRVPTCSTVPCSDGSTSPQPPFSPSRGAPPAAPSRVPARPRSRCPERPTRRTPRSPPLSPPHPTRKTPPERPRAWPHSSTLSAPQTPARPWSLPRRPGRTHSQSRPHPGRPLSAQPPKAASAENTKSPERTCAVNPLRPPVEPFGAKHALGGRALLRP